jgi:inorganic pyrophosphatase
MQIVGIIEVAKGSCLKFEQERSDMPTLILDRITSKPYPFNYGYLPNTVAYDSDALDLVIFGNTILPSGTRVRATVLGVLQVSDNGVRDDKIIAEISGDSIHLNTALSIYTDFLKTYKTGLVTVGKFKGPAAAKSLIDKCNLAYRRGYTTPEDLREESPTR